MSGLWISSGTRAALAATLLGFNPTAPADREAVQVEQLSRLPVPVSNNAVALLADDQEIHLYSMLGLGPGKTWRDTSSGAFHLSLATGAWTTLDAVPGPAGRLAASAAVAGGVVYVFGGYTVSADGTEESTPGVFRLNRKTGKWDRFTHMPVPVEDTVVLAWRDRYFFLVSGWHDVGNVNLVQVLDSETGEWHQATPWPGKPVFGHSGGIVGDRFVICDGVQIAYPEDGSPRRFLLSDECWQGRISPDNFRRIDWRPVGAHPGPPLYRMASGGDGRERVYFAGGSDNAYNFSGIGYDGNPSEPSAVIFSYGFREGGWACHGRLSEGTMDHRGLPGDDGWFYLIGGMRGDQRVSDQVMKFKPARAGACRAVPRQISPRPPE